VSALFGCGTQNGSDAGFDRDHSGFAPKSIRSFSGFPLYWLGTRFERWELSRILGPSRPDGTISFIYGTCTPTDGDEPSCSPPIDVQVMPLCRHLESVAADPVWRRRRIRGAPVGTIDNAPVLFASAVQIKVYVAGREPNLALRALDALRSANEADPVIDASEPIPAAPVAVLAGRHRCATRHR
jgi:hypothetical protein